MNSIQEFQDDFRFLSNFYPAPFSFHGTIWPTVEHAYQAYKTTDGDAQKEIWEAKTPGEAKLLGKSVALRKDWGDIKLTIMTRLVMEKFSQNKNLAEALMLTEDVWLVEGNRWGDEFWGKCLAKNQGENWLGRILMIVRSEMFLKYEG